MDHAGGGGVKKRELIGGGRGWTMGCGVKKRELVAGCGGLV